MLCCLRVREHVGVGVCIRIYVYMCIYDTDVHARTRERGQLRVDSERVEDGAILCQSRQVHLCSKRSKLIFSNGIDKLFMKNLAWRRMRMNNFTNA